MPITRKSRTTTYRKISGQPKGRRTQLPSRLRDSRTKYKKSKSLARTLNAISENKIMPINDVNEATPSAIQLGAIAYEKMFVMNAVPAGWPGTTTSLGGIQIAQGVDNGQRVGNYVYLKKTHLTLEVEAQPADPTQNQVPKQFRVIVFKQRRSVMPTGRTVYPQQTLFLDGSGQHFGHATPGKNGSDLMLQPLNKRDWVIYKDSKFTLTNPVQYNELGGTNAWNWSQTKYGSYKKMIINLPYFKKTHYSAANVPDDVDTHFGIVIYSKSLGKDYAADDWEVNIRGSTTYSDN